MTIMNRQTPAMPGSIRPLTSLLPVSGSLILFLTTTSGEERSMTSGLLPTVSDQRLQRVQIGEQVLALAGSHGVAQGGHHGAAVEDGVHDAVVVGRGAAIQILLLEDATERLALQWLVGAVVVAAGATGLVHVVPAHLLRIELGERSGRGQLLASHGGGKDHGHAERKQSPLNLFHGSIVASGVRREETLSVAEHASGKGLPRMREGDGDAREMNDDEEERGKEGGLQDFALRGEVEDHHCQQEYERDQVLRLGVALEESDRPAADSGIDETDGGDEDEPLVDGGLTAVAIREEGQHAEDEDGAEGDDVEGFGVQSEHADAAPQRIGGRDGAEDDHRTGEAEAEEAEGHVPLHLARGDESGLDEEKHHPERHDGAVDMDELVGERGLHHTGKE